MLCGAFALHSIFLPSGLTDTAGHGSGLVRDTRPQLEPGRNAQANLLSPARSRDPQMLEQRLQITLWPGAQKQTGVRQDVVCRREGGRGEVAVVERVGHIEHLGVQLDDASLYPAATDATAQAQRCGGPPVR